MSIEEIFGINPDLGAGAVEPNLWYIVYKHYLNHFSVNEAIGLADRYMGEIKKKVQESGGI